METKVKYILLGSIMVCIGLRCAKPYNPSIISGNNNYLVVEGNINTGTDSTTIKLSRTTNIASGITTLPEKNATIAIQDNQNGSYSLHSNGDGSYTSALITLDPSKMYRLNITTSDGKVYQSDFVPAKDSPPIDSIGFKVVNNNLQIYVNTHDPKNATHYYRWDYSETWDFRAHYFASYISNGTAIVSRSPAQFIYQCWTSENSSDIELGSSAKLSQDIIYQDPLITIPSTSEKIESRYTVLVKQYAMTTAGYNYYNLLKQNTEQLGSIFDAQPSTLTGNIHCVANANIPVIGFVTAGAVVQKRIYINNSQVPQNWVAAYPYYCSIDTALFCKGRLCENQVAELLIPLADNYNITLYPDVIAGQTIGYIYSDRDCSDCSIRGSTTPPSFWVEGPEGQ